jgi:cell shape-determining protein MreC
LKENDLLKQQIITKNQDQMLFGLLKKENEDLKGILNRNKTNEKLLLATVLVKPFLSAYDTLIIDTGSLDGVKINDKVLAEGSIYIGYVSEVFDSTSKVILYSSPGEKVKVLIGNNNIEKEALGLGGGNFTVQIPREIDVKEGDSVVMPSVSTNVFGIVEKVEFKESDSFQNILFKNPANIYELKWVELLLSNSNKK